MKKVYKDDRMKKDIIDNQVSETDKCSVGIVVQNGNSFNMPSLRIP